MAVICSGFSYDMEVVSHGFIIDITKTDAENEERLPALIDEAERPGERLAKLFELEVLHLEAAWCRRGRRWWRWWERRPRPMILIWVPRPSVIYLVAIFEQHCGLSGLNIRIFYEYIFFNFYARVCFISLLPKVSVPWSGF